MNQITTHRQQNFEALLRFVEANSDNRVARQILSFRDLPEGWHYREGRGATERAIVAALKINSLFGEYGATTVEAFPEIDGGILVSGYHSDHTLDVLCTEAGRIALVHEIGDEVHYEKDEVEIEGFVQYLRRLSWRAKEFPRGLLKSSDFCIQDITAERKGASRVPPSRIPPTAVVFRSSTQNAPKPLAAPNADTYIVFTTPPFRGIP